MGSSCSGKTTLAGELARRLGVPHVELDALHHGPNWQEASAVELRAKVEAALAGQDGWVTDGNYLGKLGTRLVDQADTIVWLDLPLATSLGRMWRRTTSRIRDGTELWATGNRETSGRLHLSAERSAALHVAHLPRAPPRMGEAAGGPERRTVALGSGGQPLAGGTASAASAGMICSP